MAKKNWSINVTTRNPSRLRDILRILAEFEGQIFDESAQARFIDRVVEAELYRPYRGIKDMPFRGRTWAGIFNTLGFAIAYKTYGKVVITPAGRELLKEEADEAEIFLRQLLKWQLPNPSPVSRGFGDFNVIPFVSTLHLLKKTGGLSKVEFNLFVPTLTKIDDLDKQAQKVLNFRRELNAQPNPRRKAEFINKFIRGHVLKIYAEELNKDLEDSPPRNPQERTNRINEFVRKKASNLKDYGDTIIRYFAYTGIISVRERKIDISSAKQIEAEKIISGFDGSALKIAGATHSEKLENWYEYLGSAVEPILPYESVLSLLSIIRKVNKELEELTYKVDTIDPHFRKTVPALDFKMLENADILTLKSTIDLLRDKKREASRMLVSQKIKSLNELLRIIKTLKDIQKGDPNIPDRSLWLEWHTCLAFQSINDEELVKPNYPTDENNEPTNVAVPGKPDIEAYYENFILVPEVTMSNRRDQWVMEGMPVPRHVLDLLNEIREKGDLRPVIGVFIAPSIHYDTRNQFFIVSKYGIEGGRVTIVPFTLRQFIEILEFFSEVKKTRMITKEDIFKLFEMIDSAKNRCKDAGEWLGEFPKLIQKWKEGVSTSFVT